MRIASSRPFGSRSPLLSTVLLSLAFCSGSCGGAGDAPTAVAASEPGIPITAAAAGGDGLAAAAAFDGKTVVGYQGWFGCPVEAAATPAIAATAGWRHWFKGQTPQAPQLTVDMLPDVSGLPAAALCQTGLKRPDGSPVAVFSSLHPAVVDAHFRWMKEHGIDIAAVQRFVHPLRDPAERDRSDAILAAIRKAAEAHGRKFYVTYDISGADPATLYGLIRADWQHLTGGLKVTGSEAYLKARQRPLLQLWGFGFTDRPGDPAAVLGLLADLRRDGPNGAPGASLIGGVPTGWRAGEGDAKGGAEWAKVYRSYDVISPWAVGRYGDGAGNQRFVDQTVVPDLAETGRLGLGYLPVVFPGFSWANLMTTRGNLAAAIPNRIPRQCGNFLWQQGQTRIAAGARSLFVAMFDEVDEGTAIMPVVARSTDLPAGTALIALDRDGCALPSDWYLRVTGGLAGHLKASTVPPAALSESLRP